METKISNTKWYIHHIITVLLILSGHFLPVIAPLTREGMVIVMSFAGAVYGWSFIGMLWPSIMTLFSMGYQLGIGKVFATGLGNQITWMLVFFYMVTGILNETKLIETLSAWFMTRKFVLGKPWALFSIILVANYCCSLLNVFASLIIFATVAYKMCEMVQVKPFSKFHTMMGIGLVLSTGFSAIALPFKGTGLQFTAAWTGITGEMINFVNYMCVSFPVGLFALLLYILICKFVIRVDVTPLATFDPEASGFSVTKLTTEQKQAVILLAWCMVDLCVPALLPAEWTIVQFLNKLTTLGQIAVPIIVFMVIRYKDCPIIEWQKLASKYLSWDLFLLMGVIMCLTSFLTADTTGVKVLMESMAQPLLQLGLVGFLLLIMGLAVILTNFANNFVVGMVMIPIIYTFAMASDGFSAQAALMILIFCTHFAFLTPGSSPLAGIVMSHSEWIRSAEIFKWGIPTIIILFLVILPTTYFWGQFIF